MMLPAKDRCGQYVRFFAEVGADHIRAIQAISPRTRAFLHPVSGGWALADGGGRYLAEVLGWGMEGEVKDAEIDEVLALYDQRGFPPSIELAMCGDRTLFSRLEDRGYRFQAYIATVGRPIMRSDEEPTMPEGITFRATSPQDEEAWCTCLALGFEDLDEGEVDPDTMDVARGAFQHPYSFSFLAEMDGKPVGAAGVVIRDGLAYMATASTLPKYRRRGVQTGLIRARLAHAAETGAREILHQSTLGTSSNRNALVQGMELYYVSAYLRKDNRVH